MIIEENQDAPLKELKIVYLNDDISEIQILNKNKNDLWWYWISNKWLY